MSRDMYIMHINFVNPVWNLLVQEETYKIELSIMLAYFIL